MPGCCVRSCRYWPQPGENRVDRLYLRGPASSVSVAEAPLHLPIGGGQRGGKLRHAEPSGLLRSPEPAELVREPFG